MAQYPELFLVKAFTTTADGGNAAGVVLFADALKQQRKQEIAANLGLSETAFVSESAVGDVKVEFLRLTAKFLIADMQRWQPLAYCWKKAWCRSPVL
ncbi:hypothetical protein GCM10028895_13180 [Pontibacter rugosus]